MEGDLFLEYWQVFKVVVANLLACEVCTTHPLKIAVVRNYDLSVLAQMNVTFH